MMSSGQTPTSEVPFGYTFNESDRDFGMYSHQPSNTELLDTDERDILQNFFQNPDSVDASYLFSQELQGHNGNVFTDSSTFGWSYSAGSEYTSNPGPLPELKPLAASGEDSSRVDVSPYGLPGREHEDDVYNAAKLLHDNRNAQQNHQNGYLEPSQFRRVDQQPSTSRAPAHSYPAVAPYSSAFEFDNSGNNGYYQHDMTSRNGHETAPVPTNGSLHVLSNISGDVRAGPLRFGSDEKFRNHYAGPIVKAPDSQLKEIVSQHFSSYEDPNKPMSKHITAQEPQAHSPNYHGHKRSRENGDSQKTSTSGEGDDTSEEETTRLRKRRRGKVKDEDEEFEEPLERSRRRKKSPGSPHKRRKSSPPGNKSSRENLTEEQKRSNHIQSEQRRRNLIKQGFEDLGQMVPELRSGGLSKSNVLVEVSKFMKKLQQGNEQLRKRAETWTIR